MLSTKDPPLSAVHKITMRGLAAVNSIVRHGILKPDVEEPGHIEAGHMLSLTGFSGIWEQDVQEAKWQE
jgi:hypothetical protein